MSDHYGDAETLQWIKDKISRATQMRPITNRDLYGAMHVLCSDADGMHRYIRSYRCDQKQGLIANLADALQQAIRCLEALGQPCGDLRSQLVKVDEIIGIRSSDGDEPQNEEQSTRNPR